MSRTVLGKYVPVFLAVVLFEAAELHTAGQHGLLQLGHARRRGAGMGRNDSLQHQ
jgi:hypothetical protein